MICKFVTFLLLLLQGVSSNTDWSETQCVVKLKVPRHTVFKASVKTELKINCTVTHYGCQRILIISWCKIYGDGCKALNHSDVIKTEWKNTAEHEGMAFLIFQKISMEDAGLYRCKESDMSISHLINVTVMVPSVLNPVPDDNLQWLWPYLYICSVILGLVIIMTLLLVNIVQHTGRKSTNKCGKTNQYLAKQRSDLLLPPHLCLDSDLLTTVVYSFHSWDISEQQQSM
ncbi:uncharacterized protein LOC130229239 [Danio aesculapii]|uniref:uncharacterized protein LOC130229239 n=1 Tax=Danio aesculapii TaxID=1142201 RepID=UPI0024BFF034|nr:uncharacterized protein LOC130229239 [Danio aesculapii]